MRIEGSEAVTILADPMTIWRMISDVTRTHEWSPDVIRSAWIAPADGPEVGARFESVNRMPFVRRWRSRSTVTRSDPGRTFAFAVGRDAADPNTTWSWDLESVNEGTYVKLSFEMRHEPPIVLLYYRLTKRPERVRRSVIATLQRLRTLVENPRRI